MCFVFGKSQNGKKNPNKTTTKTKQTNRVFIILSPWVNAIVNVM